MAKFMKNQCLQFLVIIPAVDICIDINDLMNRGSVDVTLDFIPDHVISLGSRLILEAFTYLLNSSGTLN